MKRSITFRQLFIATMGTLLGYAGAAPEALAAEGLPPSTSGKIIHDAAHYILEAQHGDKCLSASSLTLSSYDASRKRKQCSPGGVL